MDATKRIDQMKNICENKATMNQSHDELHYSPPNTGESNASVQIGFEPSHHLDAALQRFLIGEQSLRLLSGAKLDVHTQGGSSSGIEIQRDEARTLAQETQRLKQLHGAQLQLGKYAMMSRIDQIETKGLQIRFGLRPSRSQRQILAGHVLGDVAWQLAIPIYATMRPDQLVESNDVVIAKKNLDEELQSDEMMYVLNPYVTNPRASRKP